MALRWRRIATWNFRILLGTSWLAKLCKSFIDYRFLLHGISTVKWPKAGEFAASNGLKLILSGRVSGQKRKVGVGFLISCIWELMHSDQLISYSLLTGLRNLNVITCYVPNEVSERGNKNEFYDSSEKKSWSRISHLKGGAKCTLWIEGAHWSNNIVLTFNWFKKSQRNKMLCPKWGLWTKAQERVLRQSYWGSPQCEQVRYCDTNGWF